MKNENWSICSVTLLIILFCGCSKSVFPTETKQPIVEQVSYQAGTDLLGLGTPIQLYKGANVIDLKDYFIEANLDSLVSDAGLPFVLDKVSKTIEISVDFIDAPLTNLSLYSGYNQYDLLVKSPSKREVMLKLVDEGYKQVQIKGEMNAWNPAATEVRLQNGEWVIKLELDAGDYQYKYIVDGQDINDPHNSVTVSNGSGGTNSLLRLAKSKKENLPWLSTRQFSDTSLNLGYTNRPTQVFAYWQNLRLDSRILEDKIVLDIPKEANNLERSFIRVWAYNQSGVSNDLLIPLQMGKVVTDANDLSRSDKEAQIMYFTLVDRFSNGDKDNDDPIQDDRLKPLTNYEGGDIKGITQKIKSGYFKDLNINSLWLSPITQNPLKAYQEYIEPQYFYSGYHGYWPISSSQVDHRFGNDKDLQELVDVAHTHGINILLDYVTNHVHEEHPIYKQHPEWATDLVLPDGTKNLRIWDAQRLTTWFDTFMPSLDLSNPEVIDIQVDSTIYWLKKFGLDGYRHDATKHIPLAFWKALTRQLKEEIMVTEGRTIYQIGETYGSRDLIRSYINSGMLDAQFDFNLYFDSREVFAKSEVPFSKLVNSLEETFAYYGYHSSMGYISGNHDQARFISLASGDVSFSEDHKMAGFNRDIEVSDAIGYDKLEMLMAFIMTIPGVPVIYYGDEIGMPGAGDPDSRRMMRFAQLSEREKQTKKVVQKLTQLRKTHLALTYGDSEVIDFDHTTLVLKRQYFNQEALLVMNKSDKSQLVSIGSDDQWTSQFNNQLTNKGGEIYIELSPWSFDVLTK